MYVYNNTKYTPEHIQEAADRAGVGFDEFLESKGIMSVANIKKEQTFKQKQFDEQRTKMWTPDGQGYNVRGTILEDFKKQHPDAMTADEIRAQHAQYKKQKELSLKQEEERRLAAQIKI